MRVTIDQPAIDRLARSDAVADMLGKKAAVAAVGVDEPSSMTKYTRSGVGPQGAYAQIIVRGSGAVAWEWGSEHNPPAGQLRAALRRVH